MPAPRSIRWRYYGYQATMAMGFYVPVSVVYLLDKGYGVAFIAQLQAVFSVSLLLAEMPSGYLGDRIGRRMALLAGSLFRVAGLVGYVVVDFAAGYLLLKVLFGVGWAFRSGTKDAWLYELLVEHGDTDNYARIEGRGSTVLLAVSAAGAVAGGVLYGIDVRLPFLVNATLTTMGVPVLATMPATGGRHAASVDSPGSEPLSVREAVRTLWLQVTRPAVRWLVAYTVFLFLVFDLSRTFEQPALDAVGVSVTSMGVLYAGFKLFSAAAASTAGWLQDHLGARGTLALAAPVLVVAYGTIAVVSIAVVPVLFLYRGIRAVIRPVRNQYLNDRLEDVSRASVLSGASMVLSLAGAVARLIGGEIAAVTGQVAFLAGAGVGLGVVAGWLWLAVTPVRPTDSNAAESSNAV